MSCAIMTKNNTTTSMFKHNLRNYFCYYSGNIVIFQILLQYRCARESRCDPFANLKVPPLAGHVCKGIKFILLSLKSATN